MGLKEMLFGRKGICPYCLAQLNSRSTPNSAGAGRRICEVCGNEFDDDVFSYDGATSIGIIGASNSGKTCYAAAMDYEFNHFSQSAFGIYPLDGKTKSFFNDSERSLRQEHKLLNNTKADFQDVLCMSITNYKSKVGKRYKTYSLSMYDPAGENTTNLEEVEESTTKRTIALLLKNALNYVLLLDGEDLRDVLKGGTAVQVSKSIIDEFYAKICRYKGMRPGDILDVNLAVAISKLDRIRDDIDPSSILLSASPHLEKGYFDTADADSVDKEVRNLLGKYGAYGLIASGKRFRNVRFFGISSFGLNTSSGGVDLKPHRCTDPLMWFFSLMSGMKHEMKRW